MSNTKDTLVGLKFWVEIEGVQVAGFSECSGLSAETEVFEYAEGGWNYHTHKLPVRTKYSNITLKRGLDPGATLEEWFLKSLNGNSIKRKNVTISLYKPNGQVARTWHLRGAYPVKWSGPDLRTDAGAAALESVEFAHDGFLSMPTRE